MAMTDKVIYMYVGKVRGEGMGGGITKFQSRQMGGSQNYIPV